MPVDAQTSSSSNTCDSSPAAGLHRTWRCRLNAPPRERRSFTSGVVRGRPATSCARGPARGKFYLTYPQRLVREPLIYQLSRKFDVVFNVRGASVNEEIGIIALELDGDADVIEAAVAWLREQGVTVEPIEKNIIE